MIKDKARIVSGTGFPDYPDVSVRGNSLQTTIYIKDDGLFYERLIRENYPRNPEYSLDHFTDIVYTVSLFSRIEHYATPCENQNKQEVFVSDFDKDRLQNKYVL